MGVRSKKKDGFAWICPNRGPRIRIYSFFERAQFHIPDVMEICISFAEKQSLFRNSVRAGMHYMVRLQCIGLTLYGTAVKQN